MRIDALFAAIEAHRMTFHPMVSFRLIVDEDRDRGIVVRVRCGNCDFILHEKEGCKSTARVEYEYVQH